MYTSEVDRVKKLKKEGRNQEAIKVLLNCVDEIEEESRLAPLRMAEQRAANKDLYAILDILDEGRTDNVGGVAPWYYEQLAILYRMEKQYAKEVEILEHYARQGKAPGVGPEKLAKRLVKAKALMAKKTQNR